MIKYIFPIIVIFLACKKEETKPTKTNQWVTTSAQIINVTPFEKGTWTFSYRYIVNESTARDQDGKIITGPIEQHTLIKGKRPVEGQKVKIRYLRNGPIIFELLEKVKFE